MNEASPDPVCRAAAPRILVVEDEADLALLLTYNLEVEGYVAESVERGDEAELRLIESPPISSFWIGCCRAYLASKYVFACGRAKRRERCRT